MLIFNKQKKNVKCYDSVISHNLTKFFHLGHQRTLSYKKPVWIQNFQNRSKLRKKEHRPLPFFDFFFKLMFKLLRGIAVDPQYTQPQPFFPCALCTPKNLAKFTDLLKNKFVPPLFLGVAIKTTQIQKPGTFSHKKHGKSG